MNTISRLLSGRLLALSALFCALTLPLAAQTFSVIGLPDTQRYSESYPQIFLQQTQWIAANAQALDIRYVSHYGDVVQHGDNLSEWAAADTAMAVLDATGIPQGVCAGNHDLTPTGTAGEPYIPGFFHSFFGPARYAGQQWYRGASPSGMSSWQVFHASGVQFLTLHIECDTPLRELEWAQGVLDRNRDKPVLLTTHRYLQDAEDYTAGVPLVPSGRYPEIWYTIEGVYTPDGIHGNDFFDWFVRRNPNVFMVQCGHFHEEYRQVSTNQEGHPVHEVLADYQDDPNGGDGWLRIMEFDLGLSEIRVDSYSPHLNAWRSADESRFTLPVNFDSYRESNASVVVQDGIANYAGTRDTWIDQAHPDTSYGSASTRHSDDDVLNSLFSDDRGQALLRFEGLFGAPGQGLVPPGSQIWSAHLTLQLADDIDHPIYDPDFYLHRVLVPWQETSTWNSLGNGLSGAELGPLLATFAGDNDPDGDGMRRLDVTAAVQAWSNGSPNHGFAILPEIIAGNDDGIEIFTRESQNPLLRPRLEIVYDTSCGYTRYGVGVTPVNSLLLDGLGQPRVGGWVEVTTTQTSAPAVVCALSLGSADLPHGGGRILIDPEMILEVANVPTSGGSSSWPIALPELPSLADERAWFQSAAIDPTQPAGIAFSNGLEVRICR